MKKYIVAIDGPAGSGKSSVSYNLAKKIKFVLVKTGDMFRSIAYKIKQENIDFNNKNDILSILKTINLKIEYIDENQICILDEENITSKLLDNDISNLTSQIAKIKEVREKVLEYEREISKNNNIIIEGRDIGTVVFPNADIKIFLTASADTRAQRRYQQNLEKEINVPLQEIKKDIINRDKNDSTREIGALKIANDAIVVETDDKSIQQVEDEILKIIINKMGDVNDNI